MGRTKDEESISEDLRVQDVAVPLRLPCDSSNARKGLGKRRGMPGFVSQWMTNVERVVN